KTHADRGGHRLGDEEDLASAGGERGGADRAALDLGDPRRYADDDLRLGTEEPLRQNRLKEVAEHDLRHVDVGDDAVTKRADRQRAIRGPAEHPLGLETDRPDLPGRPVDSHHGWLVQHHPFAAHLYQGVCRPQIDRDVSQELYRLLSSSLRAEAWSGGSYREARRPTRIGAKSQPDSRERRTRPCRHPATQRHAQVVVEREREELQDRRGARAEKYGEPRNTRDHRAREQVDDESRCRALEALPPRRSVTP